MNSKEEEFLKRLLEVFKIESEEHLQAISSGLLELEKMPAEAEQQTIVETVFREAHSLKGAARSVNLDQVGVVCQALENLFSALKRAKITLSPSLFDLLHETLDTIKRLITDPETVEPAHISQVIEQLNRAEVGKLENRSEKLEIRN